MTFFPTSVIVGVDGSEPSRRALEVAAELCRATGSPLHLVHVKVTSATLRGQPMNPQQREGTESEGQGLLDGEAAVAAELGVEVAGTHLRHGGQVEETMTAAAAELEAGLLVIGEGGSGRVAQTLTSRQSSSYSTTTVKKSRTSVLVVR